MKAAETAHNLLKDYEKLARDVDDVARRGTKRQQIVADPIVELFEGLYTSTSTRGETVIRRRDGAVAAELDSMTTLAKDFIRKGIDRER